MPESEILELVEALQQEGALVNWKNNPDGTRSPYEIKQLASLADETPEGRSIVILAKQRFNLRERDVQSLHATFVPFTAQSRMSGINIDNRMIRKGSVDAIRRHVEANGGHFPSALSPFSRAA